MIHVCCLKFNSPLSVKKAVYIHGIDLSREGVPSLLQLAFFRPFSFRFLWYFRNFCKGLGWWKKRRKYKHRARSRKRNCTFSLTFCITHSLRRTCNRWEGINLLAVERHIRASWICTKRRRAVDAHCNLSWRSMYTLSLDLEI